MALLAILTTVGRKSGLVRKVPLLYLDYGDDVVMTSVQGRRCRNCLSGITTWWQLTPVDIQVGAEKKTYRMREANAEEETALWPLLEEMYTDYKEYRQRTEGVRHIPVLIFSPV